MSLENVFGSASATSDYSHAAQQVVGHENLKRARRRFLPLFIGTTSAIVFGGLLYTFIANSELIYASVTYFWWVIGLIIPLTSAIHNLSVFFRGFGYVENDNTALICSVEVCISNETVLTVRSWWSTKMSHCDVERHGVRVAMTSARRWIAENSNPGGKVARIKFTNDAAAHICENYICQVTGSSYECGNQCSVCLDDLEKGELCYRTRKCNHEFHRDCLVNWIAQSGKLSCPLCRADHVDLVPQSILNQYISREEPVVSVLTVGIERGALGLQ